MKFKKGSERFVFIFPLLGFVIKFPRISLWLALRMFAKDAFYGRWKLIRKWFKYPIEIRSGFKGFIFRGIYNNWNEYKLYGTTCHIFLQPTYFSFFGLINIQRYGESKKVIFPFLIKHFDEITNGEAFTKDGHHFANWRNFCFDQKGRIKILDYGSDRTQDFILQWGEKIVAEFDLEKIIEESSKDEN